MADEHQGDVPAAPAEGGTGESPTKPVEIDLTPLVGKGGGVDSVRYEAEKINTEEREL